MSRNIQSNREGYESPEYKAWRYAVFARDGWTCQLTGQKGGELEAHHIIPWAQAEHLRYVVSNGITLSKDSHNLVNGREEQFQDQFQRIVAAKRAEASIKGHVKKPKFTKFKYRMRNPRVRF